MSVGRAALHLAATEQAGLREAGGRLARPAAPCGVVGPSHVRVRLTATAR